MASIRPARQSANRFESTLGGITVNGQAHPLSAWFVLGLRLLFGYAFLNAGLSKLMAGSRTAQGYLAGGAAQNGNPFEFAYAWMTDTT